MEESRGSVCLVMSVSVFRSRYKHHVIVSVFIAAVVLTLVFVIVPCNYCCWYTISPREGKNVFLCGVLITSTSKSIGKQNTTKRARGKTCKNRLEFNDFRNKRLAIFKNIYNGNYPKLPLSKCQISRTLRDTYLNNLPGYRRISNEVKFKLIWVKTIFVMKSIRGYVISLIPRLSERRKSSLNLNKKATLK